MLALLSTIHLRFIDILWSRKIFQAVELISSRKQNKMKMRALFYLTGLLLFAGEVYCVALSEQRPDGEKVSYVKDWERQQRSQVSRRDARRRVLISKVSSDAWRFGLAWSSWRTLHNKSYLSSHEELERYVAWRSNTAYIQYHNSFADKFGYTLAMNNYGDMVS